VKSVLFGVGLAIRNNPHFGAELTSRTAFTTANG